MRKALLLAIGCLICLSRPASATGYYITISLSRPNTVWLAFFDDRNKCLNKASHTGWHTASWSGNYRGGYGGSYIATTYNVREFCDCMAAKGYRLDDHGYRAVWLHLRNDGRYWMGGF